MTIAQAFAKYMEDVLSLGVVGTDIFINAVPLKAPSDAWWIVSRGGTPIQKNQTGEKKKNYALSVYYRSLDSAALDALMQGFEESINSKHCDQLEGYDTIEMEAVGFQSDLDLDNQERTVGLVEVTITVYQST